MTQPFEVEPRICDPSIERCGANDFILRPNSTALELLTLQYFAEMFHTTIALLVAGIFVGNSTDPFSHFSN